MMSLCLVVGNTEITCRPQPHGEERVAGSERITRNTSSSAQQLGFLAK